jgi:peptidyl-prolyl cis-trans isomerase SurA
MNKYINRRFTLSMALCCSFLWGSYALAEQSLDRIVAVVNNGVIVESELNQTMAKIKTQMTASNISLPPADALRKQVLDQLINKRLQLQLADTAGMEITEAQVDKAILSIAQKNRLTVAQLYEELAKRGMNKTEYRKDIHDEYLIHQIQEKAITPTINISTQEADDFMRSAAWQAHNNKEYHLEDILIALPEAPTTQDIIEAKKRADALLTKLHSGTNFSEAAMAESNSTKALQGGDLGWRKLPEIPTAFASPILLAKESDIIGPIQTSNGFHLIHVAGIRSTSKEPKAENQRQQVQQYLFERKFEEALQNWMSKIHSEAFIDMNPKA